MLMLCTTILQQTATSYGALCSVSEEKTIPLSIKIGQMDLGEVASNHAIIQAIMEGEKARARGVCEYLRKLSTETCGEQNNYQSDCEERPFEKTEKDELSQLLRIIWRRLF